ncbi:MAG: ribbon-helix-helix protein, CopG family [Myxococcota bacterium]
MSSSKQRLQLEVAEPALRRLDELVEQTGCATRAELVRRALEVYDYILEARLRGGRLVLELPDGRSRDVEVALPRYAPLRAPST